MLPRRITVLVIVTLAAAGLTLSAIPTVQAKSLAGTTCAKPGAKAGDGPGRSVICKKKGKKNVWVALVAKKPVIAPRTTTSPRPTGSPQPTISPAASNSPSPSNSSGPTCQKAPEFTENFIDPSYVRVVTPIGEQTGSGGVISVRSYIHPASNFLGKELPIFAPVNMTLNSASYYKPSNAAESYQPEYSLYFDAGCGIGVKFFHIKGVVGKVAGAVPTVASSSSAGQQVTSTPVKAGEQIGWYKLGDNSVAFDFWVDNEAHTNDFIVGSHFAKSNALHSVCPYDFYTPTKKAIWLAKLGAPGGEPTPGTSCGVVNQGVEGTADGMWFISPDTETDRLTYDGAYQSQIMFSMDPSNLIRIGGLNSSNTQSQMMVSPQSSTWRKPSDVTVGASHCWSNDSQSVRVTVLSKTTISVVVGSGSCSSLPNTSTGKTYYR